MKKRMGSLFLGALMTGASIWRLLQGTHWMFWMQLVQLRRIDDGICLLYPAG